MSCCIASAFGSLISQSSLLAHAGHGHAVEETGLVHYLTEPSHLWLPISSLVVIAIMVALTVRVVRRRRSAVAA